jgi:hypothetical protein
MTRPDDPRGVRPRDATPTRRARGWLRGGIWLAAASSLTACLALAVGANGRGVERPSEAAGGPDPIVDTVADNRHVAEGPPVEATPPAQRFQPAYAPPARTAPRTTIRSTGTERPFRHDRHEDLSCLQCHGTGLGHRSVTIRSTAECGACHHDPRREFLCQNCHSRADLPPSRSVTSTLSLAVWDGPRERELPFSHERHLRVECGTCHGMPLDRSEIPSCASCHAEHHRPEAECVTCHRVADTAAHGAEAHLGCAGSGCHAPGADPLPMRSRTLCLTCHLDMREHEANRSCSGCHMIPHADPPLAGSPILRQGASP